MSERSVHSAEPALADWGARWRYGSTFPGQVGQ
jgi:hypothetical protein